MSAPLPPLAPDRRALRSRLFWVARWLLGGGRYYTGTVRVVIDDASTAHAAETLIVHPRPEDDVLDPDGPPSNHTPDNMIPRLLASFLSPDSFAIMQFVHHRGPVTAKAIAGGVGAERSKCYVLISELRERGLIAEGVDGYSICDAEMWAAIVAARAPRG